MRTVRSKSCFCNWLGGSRDLYLTQFRDGVTFSQPERLGKGTWQLNACPMDGGERVISSGKTFTAWRRAEDVFLTEPGREEVKLGAGKDVALAASGGAAFVAWSSGGKVQLWTGEKTSMLSESRADSRRWRVLMAPVVAAWEDKGSIVNAPLPAANDKN